VRTGPIGLGWWRGVDGLGSEPTATGAVRGTGRSRSSSSPCAR
jgi:hypothetical protein